MKIIYYILCFVVGILISLFFIQGKQIERLQSQSLKKQGQIELLEKKGNFYKESLVQSYIETYNLMNVVKTNTVYVVYKTTTKVCCCEEDYEACF